MSKSDNIANIHTTKKFELIEAYTAGWAQKLLHYKECDKIIFIDCMCNNGIYKSKDGSIVYGTPIRISKLISDIMKQESTKYKKAILYFNDLDERKIETLKKYIPEDTHNFSIKTSIGDGNDLLRTLSEGLNNNSRSNFLLIYDPYVAHIDWDAIQPFFSYWGEVIINHMVSDPIRGVTQAKRKKTIDKYENTYFDNIENLVQLGNDIKAFEERIHKIIKDLSKPKGKCYIASYPFFNTKNGLVYNLIHCTGNKHGFQLYKSVAWKTFGGKSSTKDTHNLENQLTFDIQNISENTNYTTCSDEYCYNIDDICKYISKEFCGKSNVELEEIYEHIKKHPIFPIDGFKNKIKKGLKSNHGATIDNSTNTVSFK